MGQESNRFVEKLKMRMLHGSSAGKGVGVASVEPEGGGICMGPKRPQV